jgi:hypothetical protein
VLATLGGTLPSMPRRNPGSWPDGPTLSSQNYAPSRQQSPRKSPRFPLCFPLIMAPPTYIMRVPSGLLLNSIIRARSFNAGAIIIRSFLQECYSTRPWGGDGRHQALGRSAEPRPRSCQDQVLMVLVLEHAEHYMLMDARGEQA